MSAERTIVWHHPEFGECRLTQDLAEVEAGFFSQVCRTQVSWSLVWELEVMGCVFRSNVSGDWHCVHRHLSSDGPVPPENLPELVLPNGAFRTRVLAGQWEEELEPVGPSRLVSELPESDILDKIDDVTTPRCAHCDRRLRPNGPSEEFCGQECAQAWRDGLVGYDEDDPLEGSGSREFQDQDLGDYDEPLLREFREAAVEAVRWWDRLRVEAQEQRRRLGRAREQRSRLGRAWDYVVVDEVAHWTDEQWLEAIRATNLADDR